MLKKLFNAIVPIITFLVATDAVSATDKASYVLSGTRTAYAGIDESSAGEVARLVAPNLQLQTDRELPDFAELLDNVLPPFVAGLKDPTLQINFKVYVSHSRAFCDFTMAKERFRYQTDAATVERLLSTQGQGTAYLRVKEARENVPASLPLECPTLSRYKVVGYDRQVDAALESVKIPKILKFAVENGIASEVFIDNIGGNIVTRCYMTRSGSGTSTATRAIILSDYVASAVGFLPTTIIDIQRSGEHPKMLTMFVNRFAVEPLNEAEQSTDFFKVGDEVDGVSRVTVADERSVPEVQGQVEIASPVSFDEILANFELLNEVKTETKPIARVKAPSKDVSAARVLLFGSSIVLAFVCVFVVRRMRRGG